MAFDSGFGAPINYGWSFYDVPVTTAPGSGTNPGPGKSPSAVVAPTTFDRILQLIGIGKEVFQSVQQTQLQRELVRSGGTGQILTGATGRSEANIGFPNVAGFSFGGSFWLVVILVVVVLLLRR